MDIRSLKRSASDTLQSPGCTLKRLVLIHTAISAAVSLLLLIADQLLSNAMASAGGLSGMGTHAVLSTTQSVLKLAQLAVMPFWRAGLIFAALSCIRSQSPATGDLLQGFRRWKPMLTSTLMLALRYLGIGFVSVYLSTQIFMFTPMAKPVYEAAIKASNNPSLNLEELVSSSMQGATAALLALFLVVFALLALPMYYRYRMTTYLIMDNEDMGGLRAMLTSRVMTYRRRMELFKLDLSFWWFYVLELVLTAIGFGDLLLAAAGVELPFSADAAFWVFQCLALAAQVGLYYLARPKLEATYAHCYALFLTLEPPAPKPAPKPPKNTPWTY